jgi:hypothetical protein
MYLFVCCIYVCVIVVNLSEAHYTQQWAVHIEGGPQVADEVARDHGFANQGQVRQKVSNFRRNFAAFRFDNTSLAEAEWPMLILSRIILLPLGHTISARSRTRLLCPNWQFLRQIVITLLTHQLATFQVYFDLHLQRKRTWLKSHSWRDYHSKLHPPFLYYLPTYF